MVETPEGPQIESELSPEWQKAMRVGIQEAIENYELFSQINVAPNSVSGGIDEWGFPELDPEEQGFVEDVLFEMVGFDPENPDFVVGYEVEAPPGATWQGKAEVTVFRTAHSETRSMFLHKIYFPDGKVDYAIAPADFRL